MQRWKVFKFGDCAELVNGRAYSQYELLPNGRYQVIRIQNLNGGANWYYSDFELGDDKYCNDGDLLFAWSASFGPYIWRGPRAIFHYHIWKVLPKAEVLDQDFAYLLLLQITEKIKAGAHGVAMLHFTKEGMEEYEVSLPPMVEQRRIAARLKAQFATVEEARKAAQAQAENAECLALRIREEMHAELNSQERVPLGDLLTGIESGKSFQTSERLASDDELGVLKVSAISWDEFRSHEAKAVDVAYAPDDRHRVKAGDLLISRANTVELVGAVVRVDRSYPKRLLSDKTLRLLIDETRIEPDYLVHILRMPEARKHIEGNATGTSDSMRNISQATIRATPIPLPTIKVQQRVAQQLGDADTALNDVNRALSDTLSNIEMLPARLLAQAFKEV